MDFGPRLLICEEIQFCQTGKHFAFEMILGCSHTSYGSVNRLALSDFFVIVLTSQEQIYALLSTHLTLLLYKDQSIRTSFQSFPFDTDTFAIEIYKVLYFSLFLIIKDQFRLTNFEESWAVGSLHTKRFVGRGAHAVALDRFVLFDLYSSASKPESKSQILKNAPLAHGWFWFIESKKNPGLTINRNVSKCVKRFKDLWTSRKPQS